jgi:hypothetical protein
MIATSSLRKRGVQNIVSKRCIMGYAYKIAKSMMPKISGVIEKTYKLTEIKL